MYETLNILAWGIQCLMMSNDIYVYFAAAILFRLDASTCSTFAQIAPEWCTDRVRPRFQSQKYATFGCEPRSACSLTRRGFIIVIYIRFYLFDVFKLAD